MKELSVFEKLRGLYTPVSDIRRKVFMYVASVMFEDKDLGELEKIPFQIVGPESPHYRCCRYKEYYILRERIRAALGLMLRTAMRIHLFLMSVHWRNRMVLRSNSRWLR